MVNGGSYDMGGVWRPDYGSAATIYFDNPSPYDPSLYSSYYALEDDYYGAYGDLLEYENQLRLSRDFSEEERMLRWRERLAFEELENDQRMRRYERMSERERQRLGLAGRSWWAGRYGGHGHGHHSHRGWRERFGDRLAGWTADRLPLSSALGCRFGGARVASSLGYGGGDRLASAMCEQDRYMRGVGEDRLGLRMEEDRLERRMEEDRLERRMEEDRLERRLDEDRLERRLEAEDRELRLEQTLDRERMLADQDMLSSRVLEDRIYGDELGMRSSMSDAIYREAEIDNYERDRGFGRELIYERDSYY